MTREVLANNGVDPNGKQLKIDKEQSPESIYDFDILNALNEGLNRTGS